MRLIAALGVSLALTVSAMAAADLPPRIHVAQADEQSRKPRLGIEMGNLTPEDVDALALPFTQGVLVKHVVPGTVAEAVGLRPFDVIQVYDGDTIVDVSKVSEITRALTGDYVWEMTVYRGGKQVVLRGFFNMPLTRDDIDENAVPMIAD